MEIKGIIPWVIIVFILWVIMTGCFWLVWEKTTYVEHCHKEYPYYICWRDEPCPDYSYNQCYYTPVNSYYTVSEILNLEADWFVYQWNWWSLQPANFIEWLMKHPIVEEKVENKANNTTVVATVTPDIVYPFYLEYYSERANRTPRFDLNISTCTSFACIRNESGYIEGHWV
jgi:hypothetical protein